MRFEKKTVIITGAGAGIGKAAAIKYAEEGANVILNSLSNSAGKVTEELKSKGYPAVFVQGDVSEAETAKKIIETAVECFGGIDVIANVAGIVPGGNIEQCTEEEWDRSMAVNVRSIYLMCHYGVPYLRKTKGVVVNISSSVALTGVKNRAAYSASKGAIIALTKSMTVEYAPEGIRFNIVCPGTTLTESMQQRIDDSEDPEEALKAFVARQPLGRLGTPEEIAEAILFASDPAVSFMSGAVISVDGAMTV